MNNQFDKIQSRRGLFKSALRYGTLGILVAFTGNLFVKRHRLARKGICINREICKSCRILEKCNLPAALSEKTSRKVDR
jgi:hypothetical protein